MEESIIYKITVEDLQNEAMKRLGRKLADDEIDIAKDAFEWGLSESNHIIYNTIFTEMIKK